MPAKSTKQQRLMGMVHAAQTGQIKNPSEKVEKLAKSMTKKSASDYASTKHKGLPKKVKKKSIKENMDYENKVGQLHIVQKPSAGCDVAGMVYEVDPISGIQQHGVDAQTVHGVYSTPEEAQKVAEKLYNEHMTGMKKLEEKKGTVANKLNKAITALEKKHKGLMETAKANPAQASSHKAAIAEIQSKIQELMDKLEMVEKSKKPIEEKEEDKKSLKENVGERKWKIGDKFTAGASDVVYTISKVSEKNPNQVIITYTDRKGENHISPTWPEHIDHYFKKGAWELVDKTNMQENVGERKWNIGDKFTAKASDVVYTINKAPEGDEIKYFESNLRNAIRVDLSISDSNGILKFYKNKATFTYKNGKELADEDVKKLKTKFIVYPHEDDSDDRLSSFYYTIEPKAPNVIISYTDRKGKNKTSLTPTTQLDHHFSKGDWELVNNKSMSEAFEPDYGPIEALGDQVEKALFNYIGAFDYELGDDEQIKEDVAVLVDKIVDKYINSAYSTNENKEESYKIGDIVIVNKGPHKGIKHEIIHVSGDGKYNIKPILPPKSKNQYRLGAASATANDFQN